MNLRIVLGIALIIFGFIYCQKPKESTDNYNYKSTGTITGPDRRMCPSPCCSGWFIRIDSSIYEFDSLPVNSNINLEKVTFPLAVKLDWQLSKTEICADNRITIQKIAIE